MPLEMTPAPNHFNLLSLPLYMHPGSGERSRHRHADSLSSTTSASSDLRPVEDNVYSRYDADYGFGPSTTASNADDDLAYHLQDLDLRGPFVDQPGSYEIGRGRSRRKPVLQQPSVPPTASTSSDLNTSPSHDVRPDDYTTPSLQPQPPSLPPSGDCLRRCAKAEAATASAREALHVAQGEITKLRRRLEAADANNGVLVEQRDTYRLRLHSAQTSLETLQYIVLVSFASFVGGFLDRTHDWTSTAFTYPRRGIELHGIASSEDIVPNELRRNVLAGLADIFRSPIRNQTAHLESDRTRLRTHMANLYDADIALPAELNRFVSTHRALWNLFFDSAGNFLGNRR